MTRVLADGRVYRGDMGASARKAHRTRRQNELDAGRTISKRTFGVEIEYHSEMPVTKLVVAEAIERVINEHVHVTSYHGQTCLRCGQPVGYDKWKIERDGSLGECGSGLQSTTGEVVSPVLTGQKGIDLLKIVMKAIRDAGGSISPRCGLHVHVGVRDLDHAGLVRLVASWKKYEDQFLALIPRGRRNNQYCRPWKNRISLAQAEAFVTNFRQGSWHKYTSLNLAPLARIGTVEVRLHGGTLNGNKAEAWIQLLLAFADAMTDRPTETTEITVPNGTLWDHLIAEKYLPTPAKARLDARQLQYR
jgi:hypothetical protein